MNIDPSAIFQGIIVLSLAALVGDHFRLKGTVSDLRVHMADNFTSNKDAEKIEKAIDTVVQRLDAMAIQLARMEGAMGGSGKT